MYLLSFSHINYIHSFDKSQPRKLGRLKHVSWDTYSCLSSGSVLPLSLLLSIFKIFIHHYFYFILNFFYNKIYISFIGLPILDPFFSIRKKFEPFTWLNTYRSTYIKLYIIWLDFFKLSWTKNYTQIDNIYLMIESLNF